MEIDDNDKLIGGLVAIIILVVGCIGGYMIGYVMFGVVK